MNTQVFDTMFSQSPIQLAEMYFKEATKLQQKGDYTEALKYFEKASCIFKENQVWEEHIEAEFKIINQQLEQLSFEGVLERLEALLSKCLSHFGKNHLRTAFCYKKLGQYYLYAEVRTFNREMAYQKAWNYFSEHYAIVLQFFGEGHFKLANHYYDLGDYWFFKGDYDKAFFNYQKMIDLSNQDDEEKKNKYISFYYRKIGVCCFFQGKHQEALQWLHQSLEGFLHLYSKQHPEVGSSYWQLARCYKEKGDYDRALQYAIRAHDVCAETLGANHIQTSTCLYLMGQIYLQAFGFERAYYFLEQFLESLDERDSQQKSHFAYAYLGLGTCLFEQKQIAEALAYFQKAWHIFEAIGEEQSHAHIHCQHYLGQCYSIQKQEDKALSYFNKALSASLQMMGKKHPTTALNYILLANYYQEKQAYKKALTYFQEAISTLTKESTATSINELPSLQSISHPLYLLEALKGKAQTLYYIYQQSFHPKNLRASATTYQLMNQTIDLIRQNYALEGSQLALVSKTQELYENAMAANLYFYQQNQAKEHLYTSFRYCEKSKSIILLSQVKDAEAKITADIPPNLLQREYDLKVEISYLSKQIQQIQTKENESESTQQLRSYQKQHFDSFQEYEALIATFEANYPTYHQLKHNIQTVAIEAIQTQLKEGQAMIEYFVGREFIFIFFIDCQEARVFQQNKPNDFEALVEDFNESINLMFKSDYLEAGHQLYQILLGETLQSCSSSIDSLLIVPDGLLTQLPFEALLTAKSDSGNPYADLPYLLMDYDIHYHYSATLWSRSQAPIHTTQEISIPESFIGFAPVYKNHSEALPSEQLAFAETTTRSVVIRGKTYQELIYSEQEINEIQSLFEEKSYKTQAFLHQKASIPNFKKSLKGYKYLHIAAHGYLNTEQPELSGILFSPEISEHKQQSSETIFSLGDAYHLQLDADLVVLSCCESGIGKLAKGEGMIAINRGFLSAGAKNVIYTLFKVYDKASCELTQSLFRHILAGKTYQQALKAAKLQLIQSGKATPRLWAGYVLIGV